ncbi:MAG TPA: hypothetical protein DCK95_04585 [Anaerolineaceae bacterium]|nr:hypothetical protein [Anaerolineaceae bacterium]
MGNLAGKAGKVRRMVNYVFRISAIWIPALLLLAGCGGIQIDSQILKPSLATATAVEQTQQAEPTRLLPVVGMLTATATPGISPTLSSTLGIVTVSPSMEESDFVSWESLIDYNLLKDIDWAVYSEVIIAGRLGWRRYAVPVPTTWAINPESGENGLVVTNDYPIMENTDSIELVRFDFRALGDFVLQTPAGKERKVRITGEPGVLWTNIVEPDRYHEYVLLFEHDGVNYAIWGTIKLPATDSVAMEKFQAMLFYVMSFLIID